MVRHIVRDAALPITWLLLHTNVTANQVTAFSLLIGILGITLFAFPSAKLFLLGAVFLQAWYLLDHVDGQIARYRGTASLTGRFFDFLTHHVIHGTLFFSLGLYAFLVSQSAVFMVWGFVASLSMMLFNLIHDTKYKTFVEKLKKGRSFRVLSEPDPSPASSNPKTEGFPRKLFSFLHKICENHVLMNVLTLAAVWEFFFSPPFQTRLLLLMLYGALVPFITVTKMAYLIRGKAIDREFDEVFKEVKE